MDKDRKLDWGANPLSIMNTEVQGARPRVGIVVHPLDISGSKKDAKVNVSIGSHLNEADVIMEIINGSHKHLELIIFEKDLVCLYSRNSLTPYLFL